MSSTGRSFAAAATLAIAVVLPAGRATGEGPRTLLIAGAVNTLDPARVESHNDDRMVLACFEGLVVVDPASGEIRPGAAEKWEVGADGRTWTFSLREGTWRKREGDKFREVGKVVAQDFVFAWLRLLDPATNSPHAHALDALPGVRALSTERPRAAALDRIVGELDGEIGKGSRTLPGEAFLRFLDRPDLEARRWLGEVDAPEAREALAWKEKDPYQGTRAKKLIGVLAAERDRNLKSVLDAEAHVGVDRAFWAKDDKTFVVQAAGPAPWIPSMVARAPLVPVHPNTVERRRDKAFTAVQNFVSNGAFVSATEFPLEGTDASGEATQFKVVLHKNPHYWNASAVPSDRIECLVNEKPDEVLRRYALGELSWVADGGVPADTLKAIRAARAPDAKTDTAFARDCKAASAGLYDMPTGDVFLLRFRCGAPLDKVEVRRALASLVDRQALAKAYGGGASLVPATRLVHPRTANQSTLSVPALDPSKAKALYGPRKYTDSVSWITFLAPPEDDKLAEAIGAAWKKGGIPDDTAVTVKASGRDMRDETDAGRWDVTIGVWTPDFDDPLAFLWQFTTRNPAGDLAWSDKAFDALVAGAIDVAGFAANPPAEVKERPAVKAALAGAKDPRGLEGLRRALLVEAESILLDQAVVVPLWLPVEMGVLSPKAKGINAGQGRSRPLMDVVGITAAAAE